MFAFLKDFLHALNPRIADTPEQIFAWRQTVAVGLVFCLLMSSFNFVSSRGFMSWIGIDGYVTVSQLSEVQQLVRAAREDQLVQQILDMTRRYCLAYDVNDQQGMAFAFQGLQEVRAKYFLLTKREYPQLMCSMSAQPAKPQ